MCYQVALLLIAGMHFLTVASVVSVGKSTDEVFGCASGRIDSRLSIVSQLIHSARQMLPKNLNECQKCLEREKPTECSECPGEQTTSDCNPGKPVDCSDIYKNGCHADGPYVIWQQNDMSEEFVRPVYCDMQDGGGWTVIQRRGDFGNVEDYFYRNWDDYKIGFGNILREFWIGNGNLFALTSKRSYQLKVDLWDWEGNFRYAIYDDFRIDNELHKYTLHFKGYNGTAGDSLSTHKGKKFTTKDKDNDEGPFNCARAFKAAWWFANCYTASLNGIYSKGKQEKDRGVFWKGFNGDFYSLKDVAMKIRPMDF